MLTKPKFDYKTWKRTYRLAHPEYREKSRQYSKQWHKENVDWDKLTHNLYTRANPEYVAFHHIRQRCNNPNDHSYSYYGGRGIKCLLTSWQQIIDTIGKRPGPYYSIDRIDNMGHYEVGNIRWATKKEQSNNTRPRRKRLFHI